MFIRDPGSDFFSIPDRNFFPSRILIKEFKHFNPTKWFLGSRKYDPDPDFLPIPDPGSRGQKGTGSRIRIRNTELKIMVNWPETQTSALFIKLIHLSALPIVKEPGIINHVWTITVYKNWWKMWIFIKIALASWKYIVEERESQWYSVINHNMRESSHSFAKYQQLAR